MLQWLYCCAVSPSDTQNELPYFWKQKQKTNIAVRLYVLETNSTKYNFSSWNDIGKTVFSKMFYIIDA